MEMTPASSSWIVSTGYDPETQTMLIETEDKTYQYEGIAPKEYADFLAAGSMGRYWHVHFKDMMASEV